MSAHDLAHELRGKPFKECGEELEVELRTGEPQDSSAMPDGHSGQGQSVASLGQQAHGAMGTYRPTIQHAHDCSRPGRAPQLPIQIPRLSRHHIEECAHWTQQEHPQEVQTDSLQHLVTQGSGSYRADARHKQVNRALLHWLNSIINDPKAAKL